MVFRDENYRAFIRYQSCLICHAMPVEAHHQPKKGHGSMRMKAPDDRAVPLCYNHHRGGGTKAQPGSVHRNGRSIYETYGVNIEAEIARLNAAFFLR